MSDLILNKDLKMTSERDLLRERVANITAAQLKVVFENMTTAEYEFISKAIRRLAGDTTEYTAQGVQRDEASLRSAIDVAVFRVMGEQS